MSVVTIPLDGERFLGSNPGVVKLAKCNVSALADTVALPVDVVAIAQTCYNLFSIPAGIFVLDMLARAIVAWTAATTFTVGDDTNLAGFFPDATLAPTTAVTTGLVKRTSANANSEAYRLGKIYAAADTIDLTVAGATPIVGRSEFYLMYQDDITLL